jgi:iron complex outermembrane receptor protein
MIYRHIAGASMTLLAFSLATAARAQDAAPDKSAARPAETGDAIQDIVVTAQFRGEKVQSTPIAITALDGAQLDQKGFSRITDITDSAPNVVMKPSSSVYGPAATIFIRGVGQQDSSFAVDPGVGIYVDDVYRGITFGSLLDLLDLERVEILRGPQGTLAGKNSIGGAVKLYAKKPDGDGGGYLDATTGSFNRIDVKGAAGFTLMPDRLFVRMSGVTRHRDGYFTRLDFNCTHPAGPTAPNAVASSGDCKIGSEGGQNYTAGRVALRWLASDTIEVNLSADRLVDDSEPPATKLISLASATGTTGSITDRSVFVTCAQCYANYSNYMVQAFTDPAAYTGSTGAGAHAAMSFPTNNRIRAWDLAGTIDIKLGDTLSLKWISGYQYTNGRYSTDNDTTPFGVSTAVFGLRYKQFTEELRLNGSLFGDAVDWTLGGYYYDGKGYLTGVNIINPGLASETVNTVDDYIPSISKSGFAHAVWHITSRLNLTGGIRYTDDQKSYSFTRGNVFVPGAVTYTGASLINGLSSTYTGNHWDYRANIDYKPTDNVLVYAQYSTGYRGGGVNPRPFVVQQAVPFNPETLQAYEVGLKSDWFDHHLRLNLSAFINNYNDMIFSNTAPTVVNSVVVSAANGTPINAGNGRFKGIEAELSARPFDGLSIDASASYLDFNLTKLAASAGITIPNVTLASIAPYVTRWKVSAGLQYAARIGSAGTLTPRIDMAYQSSFFTNIDNNPASLTPGYTIFNGRLAWDSSDRNWQVALAVTNMFDKFYYLNKFRGPAIGSVTGQPGAPREVSISLRRKF